MPLHETTERQIQQGAASQLREATVLDPPLSATGMLRVEVDAQKGAVQECPWTGRGMKTPAAGDAAAVVESDEGHHWALWWPQNQQAEPVITFTGLVYAASGAPATGLGADGDWALDKTGRMIYGPKAAGAWPTGTPLDAPTSEVTSLPATPTDGQQVDLLVDVAGTYGGPYLWRMKYRLASTTWFPVGHMEPLEVRPEWGTDRTVTSTTFVALAGVAETEIIVPLAGVYRVEWGGALFNDVNASATYMGVSVWNAVPTETLAATDADSIESYENAGAGIVKSQLLYTKRTLIVGGRVRLRYRTAGNTGRIRRRWLRVTPVRITG